MKAIVENPFMDMRAYAASLFVEFLNEITACQNEEELRRCVRLLEKRHKYDKPELSWYFKWGLISCINNSILEFTTPKHSV